VAILEEKSAILVTSIHTSSLEYSLMESRGGGRRGHPEMAQTDGYDEYDVKLDYKLDNDQLDAKNNHAIVIHNRRL
jgi:hypothetical protein